jgi:hypothetical protein
MPRPETLLALTPRQSVLRSLVKTFSTWSRVAASPPSAGPAAGGRNRPSSPVRPDQRCGSPGGSCERPARAETGARYMTSGAQLRRPVPINRTAWRLAAPALSSSPRRQMRGLAPGAMRYTLTAMNTRTIAIAALVIAVVLVIILFVL